MPVNPMTGEIESYEAPTLGASVGMSALGTAGLDAPLPMRMLEKMPGMPTMFLFGINRGSNTLLKGGHSPHLLNKTDDFIRRGPKPGKSPFLRPSIRNNAPRFKNFTQYTDLSIFSDPKNLRYSPFTAGGFGRSGVANKAAAKLGVSVGEDASAFGPGLFSAISAGRRVDTLEKRALSGNSKRSAKALAKLGQVDQNIGTLVGMNNPALNAHRGLVTAMPRVSTTPMNYYERGFMHYLNTNSARLSVMDEAGLAMVKQRGATVAGQIGVRGNQLASSLSGVGTRHLAGYARGALGYADVAGLADEALAGANRAVGHFAAGFGESGIVGRKGVTYMAEDAAKILAKEGGGVLKHLGVKGTAQLVKQGGLKVGASLGMRAGALALPGLQILAAASFAYDIGRMGGEIIKSGINLARDAGKSMRGTIDKPLMGMGYKDTEAAATSRSRGVMAIQNSRLNMRSLLGSEASMLAAHYG